MKNSSSIFQLSFLVMLGTCWVSQVISNYLLLDIKSLYLPTWTCSGGHVGSSTFSHGVSSFAMRKTDTSDTKRNRWSIVCLSFDHFDHFDHLQDGLSADMFSHACTRGDGNRFPSSQGASARVVQIGIGVSSHSKVRRMCPFVNSSRYLQISAVISRCFWWYIICVRLLKSGKTTTAGPQ